MATRLTPTIKKTIERAIELLTPNGSEWTQGSWAKHEKGTYSESEAKDVHSFHVGDFGLNSEVYIGEPSHYCTAGGIERAAWEVLGKPDMAEAENQKRVANLVQLTGERIQDTLYDWQPEPGWDPFELPPEEAIVNFNDTKDRKLEEVLELLNRAKEPKK